MPSNSVKKFNYRTYVSMSDDVKFYLSKNQTENLKLIVGEIIKYEKITPQLDVYEARLTETKNKIAEDILNLKQYIYTNYQKVNKIGEFELKNVASEVYLWEKLMENEYMSLYNFFQIFRNEVIFIVNEYNELNSLIKDIYLVKQNQLEKYFNINRKIDSKIQKIIGKSEKIQIYLNAVQIIAIGLQKYELRFPGRFNFNIEEFKTLIHHKIKRIVDNNPYSIPTYEKKDTRAIEDVPMESEAGVSIDQKSVENLLDISTNYNVQLNELKSIINEFKDLPEIYNTEIRNKIKDFVGEFDKSKINAKVIREFENIKVEVEKYFNVLENASLELGQTRKDLTITLNKKFNEFFEDLSNYQKKVDELIVGERAFENDLITSLLAKTDDISQINSQMQEQISYYVQFINGLDTLKEFFISKKEIDELIKNQIAESSKKSNELMIETLSEYIARKEKKTESESEKATMNLIQLLSTENNSFKDELLNLVKNMELSIQKLNYKVDSLMPEEYIKDASTRKRRKIEMNEE